MFDRIMGALLLVLSLIQLWWGLIPLTGVSFGFFESTYVWPLWTKVVSVVFAAVGFGLLWLSTLVIRGKLFS